MGITPQRVVLNTFYDALDTRRACEFLEEEEIDFTVDDHSVRQHGIHKFAEDRPAISMDIYVNPWDLKSAQDCLRRNMQLFPERETATATNSTDDEQIFSEALVCDTSETAEEVRSFLQDAGIWSTVRQDADDDNDKIYIVEVKADKIEQAIEGVNRWISLKESAQ